MSLVAAWLLNNTLNEIRETPTLTLVASGVSVGEDGLNFGVSGTDNVRIVAANNSPLRLPAVSGSSSMTLFMRFRTGSEVTYEQFIHSTDGANYSGYNLLTNSSGILEFMYGDNTGIYTANRRSFQGPTLTPNTDYDVAILISDMSGSASGVSMVVNGVVATLTASGTGGAVVYANNDTTIGDWDFYGTARNSSHRLRKLAILDHIASSEEIAAFSTDPDAYLTSLTSNMVLSNVPTTVRRGSQYTLSVDGTVETPVVGNTVVRVGGAAGPLATVDSVTGAGPFTVTFTIPSSIAIQHGNLQLQVAVGSETSTSGTVQFLPLDSQQFVNITATPATGVNAIASDYTALTLATGDQVVAAITSTEQSLPVSISGVGVVSITGMTENASFPYYVIKADGTVGAGDTFNVAYSGVTFSIVSVNSGQPIENGANFTIVLDQNALAVSTITLNGVNLSFTATSDTSITATHSWQNALYGEDIVLSVDGVNYTVSVIPSGYVDFEAFPTQWYGNAFTAADATYDEDAEGTLLVDGGLPAAIGDQVEYQHPSSNGVAFTIGPDWIPQFAAGNPGYITARIIDSADGSFGDWRQYPYQAADTEVPTITVQPQAQNVLLGQTATFTLSATNATSYQWYEETGATDLLISGATSSSYSRVTTSGDNGKQFYCIVTNSAGSVTSLAVGLTVVLPNVTLTSEPLRDSVTKQLRASVSNIPVRIRKADGSISYTGTVTTDSSGIFTITNNTMAVAGETVSIEFPDAASGTYSGFNYTFAGG